MEKMHEKKQKNWFQRNWKWFVPTGCLTTIILFVLLIGSIFWGVTSMIKNSDTYKYPMELANNNREVISFLGTPIESVFMIQGSISSSGPAGNASLSIPIKGPKGKGVIYIVAEKKAGRWEYEVLEIEIEGITERIQLIK